MDQLERNKQAVVTFYDLMFNQFQPREAGGAIRGG